MQTQTIQLKQHTSRCKYLIQGKAKRRIGWRIAVLAMLLLLASPALAQNDETADEPPRQQPTLDELLGLEKDAGRSERDAEEIARHEAEEALQRRLEQGRQLVDHFAEAIEKMGLSAELLDERFDTGVGTQRIQEDIIARLTHLIDEAGKQSQSSGSSSQSQRQPDSQRDPGMQEQQQQSGQQQRTGEPMEGEPPLMQQEDVHASIEETRAEWGALPERVREMLLQGRQEKFSSLYEQLTRDYYRRLASDD